MSELVKLRKRLSEMEVQYYMLQLLEAIRYLHSRGVIHRQARMEGHHPFIHPAYSLINRSHMSFVCLYANRDLKLGNLFLDRHMHIKVGDLGLAAKVSSAMERKKTLCGTPNYIAPEILEGTKGHSFQVSFFYPHHHHNRSEKSNCIAGGSLAL